MTITWSSPAVARIADLVRDRTGLVFSEARRGEVEGTIRRAMAGRGLQSADGYIELLATSTEAREALIADLTIGETYFRRDGAQFELIGRRLLPQLLADREPDRAVRVWSAGCASGEEPYSLAMLFEEQDALHRAEIVGTDISRPRLEDAQRGIYSRWSLRGVSDRLIDRYFARRGRYYELLPRIRRAVEFRYLNLAEDSFPSLSTGIWGMDLILCRNVLIYFDRETVARVARRLLDSLGESGWLLLGASDPALTEFVECDVVLTDAGLAYRRVGAAAQRDVRTAAPAVEAPAPEPAGTAPDSGPAPEPPLASWPDVPTAASPPPEPAAEPAAVPARNGNVGAAEDAVLRAWSAHDYDAVRAGAARLAARGRLGERVWVAWLRALANQGCLSEAGAVIVRALEEHPTSPELAYVNAVLQVHAGRPAAAVAAARRALYLDRTLVVAHLALADALQRTGDAVGARRSLRNAAEQLKLLPADAPVPASDGESAGRLAELVRVQLRLLDELATTQV